LESPSKNVNKNNQSNNSTFISTFQRQTPDFELYDYLLKDTSKNPRFDTKLEIFSREDFSQEENDIEDLEDSNSFFNGLFKEKVP